MAVYLFLGVFFILSALSTVIKWNLVKSNYSYVIQGVFLFILGYGFYKYNLNMTESSWINTLKQPNIISYVAIFQLVESFALILLALKFIQNKVDSKKGRWIPFFEWIPGVIFTIGFVFIQSLLFISINGVNYSTINGLYIFFTWVGMVFLQWAISKLIPEWDLQTELLIVLAFIQVLASMFLPLIVSDLQSPGILFTNDWKAILISLGSIFGLIILGGISTKLYQLYKFKTSSARL